MDTKWMLRRWTDGDHEWSLWTQGSDRTDIFVGSLYSSCSMLCVKGGHHVCDTDCGGRSKWKERKKGSLTMTLKQDSNVSSSTQVSGMGRWGRWERPVWWPQECHLEFPSREPTVGAAFPSNLQLPFLGINLGAGPRLLCPQAAPGW